MADRAHQAVDALCVAIHAHAGEFMGDGPYPHGWNESSKRVYEAMWVALVAAAEATRKECAASTLCHTVMGAQEMRLMGEILDGVNAVDPQKIVARLLGEEPPQPKPCSDCGGLGYRGCLSAIPAGAAQCETCGGTGDVREEAKQ